MSEDQERADWNRLRWTAGDRRGHYESWFQRANHPTRPLAFWIRYTIFSPKDRPEAALAELWAMVFDGEQQRVVAVKEERPIADARFSSSGLDVTIGSCRLDSSSLEGEARLAEHRIGWSLRYTSPRPPLLLLDRGLYETALPKAKALVGSPLAVFSGRLTVDGVEWPIDGWVGSQNHNWGRQHTTRYAWGQVAGFDDAPDAFLELATAQVQLGPVMTPPMTAIVLRLGNEELRFNTIWRALRAHGRYEFFEWHFSTSDGNHQVSGTISAPAWAFVGLPYYDPPGGTRTCLNSKIARADVRFTPRGRAPIHLTSDAAALEIGTHDAAHGIRMYV